MPSPPSASSAKHLPRLAQLDRRACETRAYFSAILVEQYQISVLDANNAVSGWKYGRQSDIKLFDIHGFCDIFGREAGTLLYHAHHAHHGSEKSHQDVFVSALLMVLFGFLSYLTTYADGLEGVTFLRGLASFVSVVCGGGAIMFYTEDWRRGREIEEAHHLAKLAAIRAGKYDIM